MGDIAYGRELFAAGRYDEAVEVLAAAVRARPGDTATLGLFAAALRGAGRYEDAARILELAIEQRPTAPELWSDLGSVYLQWGRLDAAVEGFRMATRVAPHVAELQYNLGTALRLSDRLAEAGAILSRVVSMAPEHRKAWVNLGATLRAQGRPGEATAALRNAVELDGDDADAQWNLSLTLLMNGRHEEGWQRYEWRRRIDDIPILRFEEPDWDGRPAPDATLLLHAEQGLGDTLQFTRLIPLARERVARVVLDCQRPLAHLLRDVPGVDQVVARGEERPPFDVQLPLMSLPHALGVPGPPTLPPHVHPEPARVERWRERLAELTGLRVGIAWQGNPKYVADRHRSIPLARFERLAALEGVQLVSLQKMHGLEQLDAWPAELPLLDLGPELDEDGAAFADTAAVMTVVDVVVTSDTATAHLAGALGVPTWVALAHVPDWRFGLRSERYDWYPDMRLFRQPGPRNWEGAFDAIAAALEQRASEKRSQIMAERSET